MVLDYRSFLYRCFANSYSLPPQDSSLDHISSQCLSGFVDTGGISGNSLWVPQGSAFEMERISFEQIPRSDFHSASELEGVNYSDLQHTSRVLYFVN